MENHKFEIKKKHETVTKTIRITIDLESKLEKLAYDSNISFNSLVIQCIEFSLSKISIEHENNY